MLCGWLSWSLQSQGQGQQSGQREAGCEQNCVTKAMGEAQDRHLLMGSVLMQQQGAQSVARQSRLELRSQN